MTVVGPGPSTILLEGDPGVLNRIVLVTASTLDRDELLRLLLIEMDDMLPCQSLGFFWHEPGTGIMLRAVASMGSEIGLEHVQIPVDTHDPPGSQRAFYSQDNSISTHPVLRWFDLYGFGASLCAPVVVARELLGWLVVSRKDPGTFRPEELRLLADVARLLGPALSNIIVRERLEIARKDLGAIKDELTKSEHLKLQVQLAYGVAHDVNNMLGLIAVRADMLRLQALPAETLSSVEAIQCAVEDGVAGIRRITQFAHEQRGQEVAAVALNRVLAEALEMTRPRWQDSVTAVDRPVLVRFEEGQSCTVMGIAPELREVMVNIILNALSAMPSGGDLVASCYHDGPWAVARISDTGCGMSEEVRQKLFEPFFTTRKGAGRGLGLWVSKSIVTRHGGDIIVESQPGIGTTFIVRLPLAAVNGIPTDPKLARKKHSILVVDDEVGLARALSLCLEASGYQVSSSGDAREALSLYRSVRHSVVITDIRMPGMTGWELAAEIKRISADTPVIAMTGWPVHLIADGDRAKDFDVILQKPCRVKDLEATVTRLLAKAKSLH
jgi:signal transduction histidine kinase/CheY-like chemotaxis protein